MAEFIGSFEDFEKYIGPLTNKVITRLGKKLKKKEQKSCQNRTLGEHTFNNENCGVYKSLDAAHFSHKINHDRKSITKLILDDKFKVGQKYKVDLNRFLHLFEAEHNPCSDKLIMLCRKHHSQYDKKNKAPKQEYLIVESDEVILQNINLYNIESTNNIKAYLLDHLSYLKKSDCYAAGIHNQKWNFNIPVKSLTGHLLCYNQIDFSVSIISYNFKLIYKDALKNNLKKDKKSFSILIPYSETKFLDQKSKYQFTLVDIFTITN